MININNNICKENSMAYGKNGNTAPPWNKGLGKPSNANTYVQIYVEDAKWYEHRYIWTQHHGDIPKGMQIHHINGKKNDNRIENLQLVTNKQNMSKQDRWGKGWTYCKANTNRPYRSTRRIGNKQLYLGYYGTPCGAMMSTRMYHVKHT
jgi:hypothetical protein